MRAVLLSWLCLVGLVVAQTPERLPLESAQLHQISTAGDGAFTTTGNDPFFVLSLPKAERSAQNCVLAFEYFCPDGIDAMQVYYGPPINEEQAVSGGRLGRAEVWQPVAIDLKALSEGKWNRGFQQLRIDLGGHAGVSIKIRGLVLRPPSAGELEMAERAESDARRKQQLAESVSQYLKQQYESAIEAVAVEADQIVIRGRTQAANDSFLAEILPHQQPWDGMALIPFCPISDRQFTFKVPRLVETQDRLCSRWCVIRKQPDGHFVLDSPARYATEFPGLSPASFPEHEARTKKGMGGVTFNAIIPELAELGVEHVTVNIVLNSLLQLQPAPGANVYEFEGQRYGIVGPVLDGLDRMIKFSTEQRMAVSAILLIGFPTNAEARQLWNHPEANAPGIFAMPNLTTPEGVRTYRAALAFLAQRYSNTEHGFIRHWIIHNEVDYAWTWTNMGRQPMALFMDHYLRSMRLVYFAALQFNPQADVYISLTHNWTTADGAEGHNYQTRAMLERLAEYSQVEGDFEWGLAYHPYPQSLFHPAAWKDSRATFDFDTQYITPKNIEVLDQYLQQPRFLRNGSQLRKVMLSEQGFHTADQSPEAERLQAAAFVYTWHKIRPLKSILCFQNHRWIDAAGEGGLLVGLRSLPNPQSPFGEKKFAWKVFQSLDTPGEPAATEFAKEIIGIKDFAEIPYRGQIR